MKKNIRFVFCLCILPFLGHSQESKKQWYWPNGQKVAISLSYDDALNSQLDNAVPALEQYGFKASFYVVTSSKVMDERLGEWKHLAANGHELGNHSIYHPCRASLPNREWVLPHHDLDKYSMALIKEELATANIFLKALDGKLERTFTPPCGDALVDSKNYWDEVKNMFVAIKGEGVDSGFSKLLAPVDMTGQELIDYLRNIPKDVRLVNLIFHGVGGDYLAVTSAAHKKLLDYLAANPEQYYVDTYLNIMEYAKHQQQ